MTARNEEAARRLQFQGRIRGGERKGYVGSFWIVAPHFPTINHQFDHGQRMICTPFGHYPPKTVELRLHSERIKHQPMFNLRPSAKFWLGTVYLPSIAEAFACLVIRHAERHKPRQVANSFPA